MLGMIIYRSPKTVIFLQSPNRRIITYRNNTYFLSMPYVLFKVNYTSAGRKFQFHSLQVGFTTTKKIANRTKIFQPPLPNMGNYVCLGRYSPWPFDSIEDMCASVIQKFWAGNFTNSMNSYWLHYKCDGRILGDFEKWQKKTRENPKWIPSAKYLIFMKNYETFSVNS